MASVVRMTISDNRVALPDLHNYENSGLPDRSMAYGLKGSFAGKVFFTQFFERGACVPSDQSRASVAIAGISGPSVTVQPFRISSTYGKILLLRAEGTRSFPCYLHQKSKNAGRNACSLTHSDWLADLAFEPCVKRVPNWRTYLWRWWGQTYICHQSFRMGGHVPPLASPVLLPSLLARIRKLKY